MYHSRITIYLVGCSDDMARRMEEAVPEDAFEHVFTRSAIPDAELAAEAQVIIADLTHGGVDWIAHLKEAMKPGTRLIAITVIEQGDALAQHDDDLYDIWRGPLTAAETDFHFRHVLRNLKRAADAWETDQYLEATINSIPSLVWYKSADGIHHKVNDAFCETVGKTKEQVQGRGHAYIWDVEADDPACIESERQVMESRSTVVSEEVVATGEGTRLLTTYKSPLYNIDGNTMGTVGVGIDVTRERAYENELIEKNRTLETIFTSMECGVLTHTLDGSRIVGVNQAALDILGYESEEDLLAAGFNMVAASVVPEDAELMRERLATMKKPGDSVNTEYRVLHDDGEIIHVMGNAKIIEADGELLVQRYLLDNTAKKMEEAHREQQQKDLIQALSEDYVLACSFDLNTGEGTALRISADADSLLSAIFEGDLTLDDCVAEYVEQVVCPEDRLLMKHALAAKNLLEELNSDKRININYRIQRDGFLEYCQATVVRIGDWDERRDIVLGIRNVDQQTRDEMKKKALLEEALKKANDASEAKSTFLSNMSHDIRTPMNAIVGFTALASSRSDQPEKVKEYLEKIQASSAHLLNLINDILDMSRIESGKATLDEQPCNLPTLMDDLYSIIQADASGRQLYFTVDTSDIQHPDVRCDKLRINQVLLNLLGNALKFTDPGGFIKLTVQEVPGAPAHHGRYRFTVSDTGIGMSAEFLEHIFDPFERERTSTVSGREGTGLGMAITKNLVEMMRGTIDVESEKGKGTTFTVELTFRLADNTPCVATRKRPNHSRHAMHGARILLVDDNDLNREIAVTLLEDEGFRVECAVNGQDALDQLTDAGPGYFQLVLMDVQMPLMNGYDATRAIRRMEDVRLARIPVIAMTADAFEEDRQKALRCGMDGHLAKPVEIDKLFETLDVVLA